MFQLTAPNAICGRVIGRGGSKINSITVCNFLIHFDSTLYLTILLIKLLIICILLGTVHCAKDTKKMTIQLILNNRCCCLSLGRFRCPNNYWKTRIEEYNRQSYYHQGRDINKLF